MAPLDVNGELLAKVNFPPYTVKMLTSRHVLIAGGGGKAKTGICNAIEIYELSYDGKICRAQPCCRYETGDRAIMNCTTFHNGRYYVLAAGMDGSCQLYQLKIKICSPEIDGDVIPEKGGATSTGNLRRRLSSSSSDKSKENKSRRDSNRNSLDTVVSFSVQPLQCVQTDFSAGDEAFQKIVRTTPDLKKLITGGADGHLRIWEYPEMKERKCIEAHKDEIDDLDVNYNGSKIVSVSRDGHGYIWNGENGNLECQLVWTPPDGEKYRNRNCRFGIAEGDTRRPCLFTTHIPVVRQRKPLPCFLLKWDANTFKIQKQQEVGIDVPSSMAISDDGRFLALGTMSGNVDVYIAFSLQRVVHSKGSHNIFVTGLEFVPSVKDGPLITGDRDASVISISVDNQIKILHVSKQVTIGVFWVLVMFVFCLFCVFTLMSYLGL